MDLEQVCKFCFSSFGLRPKSSAVEEPVVLPVTSTAASRVDTDHDCDQPASKKAKLDDLDPTDTSTSSSSKCILCLGLNDPTFITKLVDKIEEKLITEEYKGISSFVLAVHAPLSLKLRRMGVEHFIHSLSSTSPGESIAPQSQQESTTTISSANESMSEVPIKNNTTVLSSQKDLFKPVTDEYYVKTNVRLRVKQEIESRFSHLVYNVDSPFLVTVKLDHSLCEQDCMAAIGLSCIPKQKSRNRHQQSMVTTTTVNDSIASLSLKDYVDNKFFLTEVPDYCAFDIEFTHRPVFVGGRYNKFSRTIPQTPWFVDGERKAETSVEELICEKITALVRADDHNFASSGREDVDVRMLGNGRPFLIEFLNPRNLDFTEEQLTQVEKEINEATTLIKVQSLKRVTKKSADVLRKGDEDKVKCYSSVIWTPSEISPDSIKFLNDIKELEIHQKTPIRVLHRRTLSTRNRTIHDMEAEYVDKHHFSLLLSTQAGTYIKEFVHSDFGRTQPNLRDLMKQDVDILSLDVLEVKVEWPI